MFFTSDNNKKLTNLFPHIGCHVSIAGGIEKAPKRASILGCEVFQIFSRSPQGGQKKEIDLKQVQLFKENMKKFSIYNAYIHSPYYINFASKNNRIRYGSAAAIQKELETANLLGIKYVITHLGSVKDLGEKKGIAQTISMLQKTLEKYSGKAKLLLENTAGAGNIIGDKFSELEYIIKKVNSKYIEGICLDTQHSFASGYDWRQFNQTLKKINQEMLLSRIKLIHANDSLSECGSHIDRHAHIGEGKIGLAPFQKIVQFAHRQKIDMILETQPNKIKKDARILKNMRQKIIKANK